MISCSNVSILQYQHCLYFLSRTVIIMNMRNALSATRQTLQVTPQQRTPEAARHAPLDSSKTSRGTAPVSTAKQILSQRLARLPYLNADANRASPTPGGTHHAPPVLRASSRARSEVRRVKRAPRAKCRRQAVRRPRLARADACQAHKAQMGGRVLSVLPVSSNLTLATGRARHAQLTRTLLLGVRWLITATAIKDIRAET